MKVLVTGAAGLIGSHLCDALIKEGHTVTGVDDLSFGNINNVNKNVNFIPIRVESIRNQYGPKALQVKYDVIYHLASLKKVWDGSISSCNVMDVNYNMTSIIVEKAIKDKSKLIFTSTSDIYGNSKTFSEDDNITMGPPTNLRYSYALSKWHSEQYILNASKEYNLNCSIVRVFGCASSRSNRTWSGGHVPLFVNLALNNKDINIHGDGLQTRSISHAIDIATGLVNMINVTNEIVNLGTDEQTTVKWVAEYIVQKTNSKSKINYIPRADVFGNYNEILVRFANITKANELIDYKINFNTKNVIDEIIQEFSK